MQESIDKITPYVIQYSLNLLAAVVIFVVGKWTAGLVSQLMEKALSRTKIDMTLVTFSKNIAYFTMLAFVCIAALNKLGVETSSFLALIGAAGLAVGLALQGSLSNFAAGVMMIIFHPFRVGDHVETAGADGKVTEIQMFNTILITRDNKQVIIPNAKITSDKIIVHPK